MLKLWGRKTSSNVMKVIWLLEELKIPFERVDVGGPFGGTGTPEYRAMNPLGVVPSLEEEGFTLFESNAILRYLCNTHAPTSAAFYPAEPRARAGIEAWMDFQQTALNRPQSIVFQGLVRIKPEDRDHAAIAAAITEVGGVWAILDARLAVHPYVVGETFSIADITFGVHVHRWLNMDFDRPAVPHVSAWYARLLARPAYQANCAGAIV